MKIVDSRQSSRGVSLLLFGLSMLGLGAGGIGTIAVADTLAMTTIALAGLLLMAQTGLAAALAFKVLSTAITKAPDHIGQARPTEPQEQPGQQFLIIGPGFSHHVGDEASTNGESDDGHNRGKPFTESPIIEHP